MSIDSLISKAINGVQIRDGQAPRRDPVLRTDIMTGPLQRIAVETLFENVDNLNRTLSGLIEHDFEVRYLDDQFDPCGTLTAWLLVWTITRSDVDCVIDVVSRLVEPHGGIVSEGGVVSDEELEAWIRHDDTFAEARKLSGGAPL